MSKILNDIRSCFEPASRAIRRGDPAQMERLVDQLAASWRSVTAWKDEGEKSCAQGMKTAVEAMLNFALARSRGDAAAELVRKRKHALPVLHALARHARETARDRGDEQVEYRALTLTELARRVGAKPQNLGEILREMGDLLLIESSYQGTSRGLRISADGVSLLESLKPGWQSEAVTRDEMFTAISQELYQALTQTILQRLKESNRRDSSEGADWGVPNFNRQSLFARWVHSSAGRGVPEQLRYMPRMAVPRSKKIARLRAGELVSNADQCHV